jgi:hypothetical protein
MLTVDMSPQRGWESSELSDQRNQLIPQRLPGCSVRKSVIAMANLGGRESETAIHLRKMLIEDEYPGRPSR